MTHRGDVRRRTVLGGFLNIGHFPAFMVSSRKLLLDVSGCCRITPLQGFTQPTPPIIMARTALSRSISFDPSLFDAMEKRRASLMMERSEYIMRCIMRDIAAKGDMVIREIPQEIVPAPRTRDTKRKRRKND